MPTAEQFLKMVFPNGFPSTTQDFEYSCQKCNDTGHIIISKFPLIVEDCECEKHRRLERRINRSGLAETMKRCTFDSFNTSEKWQETVKNKALEAGRINHYRGDTGRSRGAGKDEERRCDTCRQRSNF